jgi:hypothetical protein
MPDDQTTLPLDPAAGEPELDATERPPRPAARQDRGDRQRRDRGEMRQDRDSKRRDRDDGPPKEGGPKRQTREKFFVRSFDPDNNAYQVVFYDEAGTMRELTASVSKDNPNQRDIHTHLQRALNTRDGKMPEAMVAKLVLNSDDKTCALLHVEARTKSRKIMTENGEAEWSDAMEEAINVDMNFAFQKEAMAFHQSHMDDPELRAALESKIAKTSQIHFREAAAKMGFSKEQIEEHLKKQTQAPRSYEEILSGKENGSQVRYDLRYGLDSQDGHLQRLQPAAKLEGVMNYATQKALHDACTHSLADVIEQREKYLHDSEKTLGIINPDMPGSDRAAVSVEKGRLIAAYAQASLSQFVGAEAANPQIDELEWQMRRPENCLHSHIAKGVPDAEHLRPSERLSKYAQSGIALMDTSLKTTAEMVGQAHKAAIPAAEKPEEKKTDLHPHMHHLLSSTLGQMERTIEMFD